MRNRNAPTGSLSLLQICMAVIIINMLSGFVFYHIAKPDNRAEKTQFLDNAITSLQKEVAGLSREFGQLKTDLHDYRTAIVPDTAENEGNQAEKRVHEISRASRRQNGWVMDANPAINDPGTVTEDPAERRYLKENARQQIFDAMDANFYDEEVDEAWAVSQSNLIDSILQQDRFADISLISGECRTQSCRLEFVFPDKQDIAEKQMELINELSEHLQEGKFSYDHRDGNTVTATAYFRRSQ